MKTYNLFLIAIFSLIGLSCEDYLEKQPTGDLTMAEVFTERNLTEQFLSNIYQTMPNELNFPDPNEAYRNPFTGGCEEMEIAYGGAYSHLINDGSWGTNNIQNTYVWTACYKAIRKCNIFLENIDKVQMSNDEKETWKHEVFFQRAFNYFQIFRCFGPFPIIDVVVSSDADFSYKRSPVPECIAFIVADLDKAIAGLPDNPVTGRQGMATTVAAMALKSRLLLYAASPLWNGNSAYAQFKNYDGEQLVSQTYDASLWQKAADAALACINKSLAAGYGLYRSPTNDPYLNYSNIWQEHYNKEWLFYRNNGNYQHMNMCSDPVSFGAYSIIDPTQDLVDAYQMADGSTPITGYTDERLTPVFNPASGYSEDGFTDEAHPNGYHPAGVWKMYANREPRFYASINFCKQIWKDRELQFWSTGRDGRYNAGSDYCKTGYLMKKIIDHNFRQGAMGSVSRPTVWVYYRLAEQYLNYAEALNEAQGPVADVYKYVNEVRDRAGLPGLQAGLNKDQMRERIWHERRIELAFEVHRFFDARRWKIAEVTENTPVHSLDIFSGTTATDPAFYKRIIVEPRVFNAPKHYLLPIQELEFDKTRDIIVQNPGWPGSNVDYLD